MCCGNAAEKTLAYTITIFALLNCVANPSTIARSAELGGAAPTERSSRSGAARQQLVGKEDQIERA